MDHRSDSKDLIHVHDVLATLLEAALRDQKQVRDAIRAMELVSTNLDVQGRSLPGTVSAAVNKELEKAVLAAADILTGRVQDANTGAREAANAFRRAAKHATLFVFAPALIITALTMVIWYGITANSVRLLREEKVELQHTVNTLGSQGGRLIVGTCEDRRGNVSMCIQVTAQEYVGGYRIPVLRE